MHFIYFTVSFVINITVNAHRGCFLSGIIFCGEVCGAAVKETVCVFF